VRALAAMPVGCLGAMDPGSTLSLARGEGQGTARGHEGTTRGHEGTVRGHEGTARGHEGTARGHEGTARGQAERMELMQQTLLIQIFRLDSQVGAALRKVMQIDTNRCKCDRSLLQAVLSCSTCAAFSRTCCQAESGWTVLAGLVGHNSRAVWSPGLVRAVGRLRLQVRGDTNTRGRGRSQGVTKLYYPPCLLLPDGTASAWPHHPPLAPCAPTTGLGPERAAPRLL
jgi:hypothetical protein